MKKTQYQEYERSLKKLRDEYAIKTTAYKEGFVEGFMEGFEKGLKKGEEIGRRMVIIEPIKSLLKSGKISVAEIADVVSLDIADVLKIQKTIVAPEK